MVGLQCVECSPTAANITDWIVGALSTEGGLDSETIAKKLISFGADGCSAMQGNRASVTQQIKEKFASFAIGVHCVTHRYNLTFKALPSLGIFGDIEKFLSITYSYFCKSPKRFSKF